MKSEAPLDYAVLQLSPRRTRCELFVSRDGDTEKLASGLVKQFMIHLKAADDQVQKAVNSIKLEVERNKNAETWFTKGTLERFVQFTSTPEVLELVNTFDAEMSQLEAARKIYSQGTGTQHVATEGDDGKATTVAADATKKELLRAIDVRLAAVRQDLMTACAHASAAAFNPDTVSELQLFADEFGAQRLNEACTKFMSLCQRRPDLMSPCKPRVNERDVRSSYGSDMSIDDPSEDASGSHNKHLPSYSQTQQNLDQTKPSTCPQPKSCSSSSSSLQRTSDVKEKKEEPAQDFTGEKKDKGDEVVTESSTVTRVNQPGRRLSVQDRINLFENRQKESSGGCSGGGKSIVGKSVELRRLSSDLSSGSAAVEKAVLRRWSGASDMSIDVSGDKKDTESPLCTPSSVSSASQTKFSDVSEDKDNKGLSNTGTTLSAEPRTGGEVGLKEQIEVQPQIGEYEGLKTKNLGLNDHGAIKESKFFFSGEDKNAGVDLKNLKGSTGQVDTGVKIHAAHQSKIGANVGNAASDSDLVNKVEDAAIRSQLISASRFRVSHNHSRSFSGQYESGVGSNFREASSFQLKEVEGDQFASQPHGRSFSGDIEESMKKDYISSSKQKIKVVDYEVEKMKYQKPVSDRQQFKKSQSKWDGSQISNDESKLGVYSDVVMETQDSGDVSYSRPMDQVQRVRKSRSTQGVNDDLKMKADELEKLFAEHKLRVPGDQSASARRSEMTDKQIEHAVSSQYRRPAALELASSQVPDGNSMMEPTGRSINVVDFKSSSLVKTIENLNSGDSLRQGFSPLNLSDGSRGKLYHRYMQKRDEKLREEWSTNRSEKEARMKAMHDSLERSRSEMKERYSGADGHRSVSTAPRHAEKLRSFNVRSNINRGQHPIESLQNEDMDLSEFMDSGSKSTIWKKTLAGRSLPSSTPRLTSVPLPRSSTKAPNPAGRRRVSSENPLSQSVPNFSDLRKENTQPSSGVSKPINRAQVRNNGRSKGAKEDEQGVKDEKSKRSQILRKSSANNPTEYKDISSLKSDNLVLAPLKFDTEQILQEPYDDVLIVGSRTLVRQAGCSGPGAGASVFRKTSSAASDNSNNDEEDDELASEAEESVDIAKEEEDDVENMASEECSHSDLGKGRLLQDSDKSEVSGTEVGDSTRSFSHVDPMLVAGIPATMASSFNNVGYVQESPVESPVSWQSQLQQTYTFPQEISDVDAYAESPIGSPASWNSHALTQTEADAARMRKKWGSAQKPALVANSSQQSRRDMARGFKRLLKFGRKSRGSETLVDWVSATTSEGDDDPEDGRDPANRSSEDLRKSRMRFSQGQPSDDGFNESELFCEQVPSIQSSIPAPPANFKLRDDQYTGSSLKAPRSFFSLPTFRKGNDSKPR